MKRGKWKQGREFHLQLTPAETPTYLWGLQRSYAKIFRQQKALNHMPATDRSLSLSLSNSNSNSFIGTTATKHSIAKARRITFFDFEESPKMNPKKANSDLKVTLNGE